MSVSGRRDPDPLAMTLAERVDRACDAFEAEWRSGRRPRIETYLAAVSEAERPALLGELLAAELELRLASGESFSKEEYERRFPDDVGLLDAAFGVAETPGERGPGTRRDGVTRGGALDPIHEAGRTAPGPLEPTGAPMADGATASPASGLPSIPGFEIRGELGRGGMGVVYLAREIRLNRPCALKMIRAGRLAGARETGRFLAEAEAVAKLSDPNIVQVYSLGEWEGLPYLELEYVEGGSLAEQLDGTPRPPEEAARLIETLARSIGVAHERGIVHRDLKPANVLMTTGGRPKITDFGLAKALDADSGLTQTEEILGTPSYMAPEQAGGKAKQAGPPVDVYALGVVLYELLTGRRPFRAATVMETLELVRGAEPVPPSRLVPRLPRDLETICLKCLQKEPSRRYDSATAMADDLGRYLEGRPILARPVGPAQRLWRWCRRQPIIAGLTAAVAALLVASAVGAGVAAYQFRQSAERERAAAALAGQNLERARQVVEEMYAQVALQLDDQKGMDDYQRDILQKALGFYEGFAMRQSRSPEVRFETGRANVRVGSIQFKLGRVKEAEAALTRTIEIVGPLVDEFPDVPEYRQTLGQALGELGKLQGAAGRTAEAERSFDRSVETLRVLATTRPQVASYQRDLAKAIGELALVLALTGRMDRGLEMVRESGAIYARLIAATPDVPSDRLDLAKSRTNLGELLRMSSRPRESEAAFKEAISLAEELIASQPRATAYRAQLALTCNNLGELYRQAGRWDQAEESHRKALALREGVSADHPEVVAYENDVAASQLNMGNIHAAAGRLKEAETAYRKSVKIREKLSRDDPEKIEYQRYLATAHNNLAVMYADARRLPEAEAEYLEAISVYERVARSHPDQFDCVAGLGNSNANLGGILLDMGRRQPGLERLARGAELLEDVIRRFPQHTEAKLFLGGVYFNRASLAKSEKRHADALADWDRAIPLLAGHPYQAVAAMDRAMSLARLNDHARAAAEAAAIVGRLGRPAEASSSSRLFYTAACVQALASAAASKDEGRPRPEREAAADRYAAAAVAFLVKAGEAGYFRDASARQEPGKDTDLDALRSRADFRLTVMDLAFPDDPFVR